MELWIHPSVFVRLVSSEARWDDVRTVGIRQTFAIFREGAEEHPHHGDELYGAVPRLPFGHLYTGLSASDRTKLRNVFLSKLRGGGVMGFGFLGRWVHACSIPLSPIEA
ncbi:MAG: hypothetical protein KJ831_02240 [Candidatus Eisenbacteria bacterium]|nr:hypothetical protein [Candidatus Eisenbacteria bacterium]